MSGTKEREGGKIMKGTRHIKSIFLFLFFGLIVLMGQQSWHQTYPMIFLGVILGGLIVIPLVFTLLNSSD